MHSLLILILFTHDTFPAPDDTITLACRPMTICKDPCVVFTNRIGCQECACPSGSAVSIDDTTGTTSLPSTIDTSTVRIDSKCNMMVSGARKVYLFNICVLCKCLPIKKHSQITIYLHPHLAISHIHTLSHLHGMLMHTNLQKQLNHTYHHRQRLLPRKAPPSTPPQLLRLVIILQHH